MWKRIKLGYEWDVQGSSQICPCGAQNVLGNCCGYQVFRVILFTFLITRDLITIRREDDG